MSDPSRRPPLADAAVLGAVSGLRTFTGPAVLALRGRFGAGAVRGLFIAAALGELVGDKLPMIPPRSDPAALLGRVLSGATVGGAVAGRAGAGAGAASAAATTYVTERLRAGVGERTGIPDPWLGLGEDVLAAGVAVLAGRHAARSESRPAPEAEPGTESSAPEGEPGTESPTPQALERPLERPQSSRLRSATRGLAAAAVGTAAMTSAQIALHKATGGEPSSAPQEVGGRIIKGVFGRRVPRRHRPALNQVMHGLYGTSWGLPFGLGAGARPEPSSAAASGVALGLTVWGASLIQLPALDLAPAPWRQSPAALVSDLGFHLVYGAATAAAYRAFGG